MQYRLFAVPLRPPAIIKTISPTPKDRVHSIHLKVIWVCVGFITIIFAIFYSSLKSLKTQKGLTCCLGNECFHSNPVITFLHFNQYYLTATLTPTQFLLVIYSLCYLRINPLISLCHLHFSEVSLKQHFLSTQFWQAL